MSLARRSINSIKWLSGSNLLQIGLFFLRSVLLARILSPEDFGVYVAGQIVVELFLLVAEFGLGGALLNRMDGDDDSAEAEERAAATHFTLKLITTTIWIIMMLLWTRFFVSGVEQQVYLALIGAHALLTMTSTPRVLLTRRVVHRRMALMRSAEAFLSVIVAVAIAYQFGGPWGYVSTHYVAAVVAIIFLYGWRPVWRPKLRWEPARVRYFFSFGWRNMSADVLLKFLDTADDLYVRYFIGAGDPLGFYRQAYRFARYPAKIIAGPINIVAFGAYAELKGQREQLSRSFVSANAVLVRSGFFLAGIFALIAPEFVDVLIGEEWRPMLPTFRLMLLFTLLDPLKKTVGELFVAVGEPQRLAAARFVQMIVLVVGLALLGPRFDIAGVAITVNLMLFVGIALLFWIARRYVDYSLPALFGIPTLALGCGGALTFALLAVAPVLNESGDILRAVVKMMAFTVGYGLVMFLFERHLIMQMVRRVRNSL